MSTRILIIIYLIVTLFVCLRVMRRGQNLEENTKKIAGLAAVCWLILFGIAYAHLLSYGLLGVLLLGIAPKAISEFNHERFGEPLKALYVGWWLSIPVGFYYLAT